MARRRLDDDSLAERLEARAAEGLYRQRRVVSEAAGVHQRIDGRQVLAFCSNDYLGLATDPRLKEAQAEAAWQFGAGAGAAHLINGHFAVHHELEERLAEFTGRERALLFSTGYMANLGIASALVGRGDAVFEDRLNHASLLDAGLLSGARFSRYAHADADALEKKLAAREQGAALVMTDGVFSMDGDVAPLPGLASVCADADALLVVDDAHGLGVLGKHGGGSLEAFELDQDDVPVLMGTLGKAFGSFGAFVAGSDALIETLIQFARSYVYTTALPPGVAAASLAAVGIIENEPERRSYLNDLIARFRKGATELGLDLMDSHSPIQPIMVGDAQRALSWSEDLLERGMLVTAIRPPTVPAGTARLRVTLSAEHTRDEIDRLLQALADIKAADASGDGE
ncbi:MAG: 8-amino-7-oxononanoate synthase [Gammaproteobacteria bacterium]|nr:8-amino-7-oxononanoate synthase [Gammaproteobacteria bacterium]